MILAVEDRLSEAVALSMVKYSGIAGPHAIISNQGKGYLRTKAQALNRSASAGPIMLLTDIDNRCRCPMDLIRDWVPDPLHRNFIFRVVVMEIESWVLADREAAATFLGVSLARIPLDTDAITDPKQFLINLARRSTSRRIREELVPRIRSTALVGPAYNPLLREYVNLHWNPKRASKSSPSLRRALVRLRTLSDS